MVYYSYVTFNCQDKNDLNYSKKRQKTCTIPLSFIYSIRYKTAYFVAALWLAVNILSPK